VSDYTPDKIGMAAFLTSEMLLRVVEHHAHIIMDKAIVMAPVGEDEDYHPGRYKASFHVRSHHLGGATGDRVEAIVYNDSPEAKYVEYGHRGREPYHTLLRAAHELRM
jgi:hypothetical protein